MAELQTLMRARGAIKAKLTRIERYVNDYSGEPDKNDLEPRLAALRDITKEFDEVQFNIEGVNPSAAQSDDRDEFEAKYFSVVSKINNILDIARGHERITRTEHGSKRNINVNLPALNLPQFSGSYSEWSTFYNTFVALIDEKSNISDCEKFHYLRSSLKGEALRSVESLHISAENYKVALDMLRSRFENTRLIVFERVNHILKLPAITKSTGTSIRQLLNTLNANIEALRVLKLPVDNWDALIVPIIMQKLDFQTNKEWQATLNSNVPALSELVEFLDKRCKFLESLEYCHNSVQVSNLPKRLLNHKNSSAVHVTEQAKTCPKCKGAHILSHCPQFLSSSIQDRFTEVNKLGLCLNCFRSNHLARECRASLCRKCGGKHHSLLHSGTRHEAAGRVEGMPTAIKLTTDNVSGSTPNNTGNATETVCNYASDSRSQLLLSTVLICVRDPYGKFHHCRALLDSGAQSNIITEDFCKRLHLATRDINFSISGINQRVSKINKLATVTIKSRINDFLTTIDCLVLQKITQDLPAFSFDRRRLNLPQKLEYADPDFDRSRGIDMLIGVQLFWDLLIDERIRLRPNEPILQNTLFGWVIGGPLAVENTFKHGNRNVALHSVENRELESLVAKFFELDQVDSKAHCTPEHLFCETHFKENVKRESDGRFIVGLPVKNSPPVIGSTYEIAKRRFLNLERKFGKDPGLKGSYADFMRSYRELGHMELVNYGALADAQAVHCFLPHHPVLKPTSTTTKLRVVFDASCKSTNGLSLNDNLHCGPVIQQDLISILLRFRTYQYVLGGDIAMMYRQIYVKPEQTSLQLVLWRDDVKDEMRTFRLNTITYGTKPASFLATRCLHELALEHKHDYPLASDVISRDFYMDDLITGSDDINTLVKLRQDISYILKQGGFDLRKFVANDGAILPTKTHGGTDAATIDFDKNGNTKTLGLIWNCFKDELKYSVDTGVPQLVTKRGILSLIARIFDPLGLLAPVITKAKIIMQQVWLLKIEWDAAVPDNIRVAWMELIASMHAINSLNIERKVIAHSAADGVQIHIFVDASTIAYGACIYVRSRMLGVRYRVNLLCAKGRVAPLKTVSVPRLELCAAVLGAQLAEKVGNSLNVPINQRFFWTDSTVVLSWLGAPASTWQLFVANRVAAIHSLTKVEEWKHVATKQNPADLVSRGAYAEQLANNEFWFHGPGFLREPQPNWPSFSTQRLDRIPETRNVALTSRNMAPEISILSRCSGYTKLLRIFAYVLRFVNLKRDEWKDCGITSALALNNALLFIARYIQRREFAEEFADLMAKRMVSNKSKLSCLSPFIDENGLIRVGGRLKNADIAIDAKHPIVMPKNHNFTRLLIKHEHERHLHAGPQATLAAVRQKFWIISGRSSIRSVLRKCVKCFRANPKAGSQKMGNLPKARVTPARPFLKCGVDYAGPIMIREARGRGKRLVKGYIAVFVCFVTKAVHLELVTDLTSETFLNCLKRVIARRGYISEINCDNATNFVGARREIQDFFKTQNFKVFLNNLAAMKISWKFIPPRSPHMGGLWEINVRSVKHHLRRVTKSASLTFEEMYTLLCLIEATLNSRPLVPLTDNPNDLSALTPGHFLIGEPLTSLPEENLMEVKLNRLSRWQHLQRIRQHFWVRWSKEYLAQLQTRTKWRREMGNVKIGAMVVLAEDNIPPQQWRLGRVVELHAGNDGLVRVVSVKTVNGVVKRALAKLCVLPIDEQNE